MLFTAKPDTFAGAAASADELWQRQACKHLCHGPEADLDEAGQRLGVLCGRPLTAASAPGPLSVDVRSFETEASAAELAALFSLK